jgi:hypothetical protein
MMTRYRIAFILASEGRQVELVYNAVAAIGDAKAHVTYFDLKG